MVELIRYIKKLMMRVLLYPLRIIPVKKNRVLLINSLAQKYSGNPKAIAEYLVSAFPDTFDIVFSLNTSPSYDSLIEKGIKPVRFNSIEYFFYAMTAKVIVTNSGGFSYLPLRKSQYVINTWHGGGAYKKCGLHVYGDTKLFRKDLELSAKKANCFLSTNRMFSLALEKDMLIPKKCFWEIGMPRNDMLISGNNELKNEIRTSLDIGDEERLLLFAPTYRKRDDNYFNESVAVNYGIDTRSVCNAMGKRFGGKWIFAFRLHPLVENRDMIPSDAIDLSDYEDIQNLLLAADAMINDFSSSMWDFMLTGKPCFTFAVDLQHYIETTEVYTPVDEWPFPKATSNDELIHNILCFDEKKYKLDCKRHYDNLGGCETGRATELVCDRIYDVCCANEKK